MLRLGVVSFLNARPLIEGLRGRTDVACVFDVPAALPGRLERGDVDVALVPLMDVLRSPERYRIVSDACIASDGETRTVRVFSQVPPAGVRELWVDGDSHTSVVLARVLWRELHGCDLVVHRFESGARPSDADALLLIGDKVVAPHATRFAFEVDLGQIWRDRMGLPFVFAVWARLQLAPGRSSPQRVAGGDLAGRGARDGGELADLLSAARDRGVPRAAEIAAEEGPGLGWPVELARDYLTRCMKYRLDARTRAGAERFAACCAAAELIPAARALSWPEACGRRVAGAPA